MKLKATVAKVDGDTAILDLGSEQIAFPLSSLPDVTVGSVMSIKMKVENRPEDNGQEALEVMSSILDRSCSKD